MFEKMTDNARQSVVLAQEEARFLHHTYIGAEHLLLGVLRADADNSLEEALGASPEQVRDRLAAIVPPEPQEPAGHIPFTPGAKKSLELSLAAAMDLHHTYMGTEHLLIGVLNAHDRTVEQILAALRIDRDDAAARARQHAAGQPSAPPRPASRWRRARSGSQVVAALVEQRDLLVRALHRYARHEAGCPAPASACTCGLDDARLAARGRPESGT